MKYFNKALLSLFFLGYTSLTFADEIVILGQNNQALDRLAIQNAINSAQNNRTIMLQGTFQLDGVTIDINKSNITLLGAGNEGGWSTVLVGLLRPNGTPQLDLGAPTFHEFNRGFKVSHDASNITIKGIKFINLNRAITIAPQLNSDSSLCSDYTISSGGANYLVSDGWFDNDALPIFTVGEAKNITYDNNMVTNSGTASRDLGISGLGGIACRVQNSQGNFVTTVLLGIGIPKNATISGNTIQSDKAPFPIVLSNVINGKVINNMVIAGANAVGIITMRTDNGLVRNNTIDLSGVGFFGIAIDEAASPVVFHKPQNLVIFNTVTNSISDVGVGIAIDNNISDVLAHSNKFSNIGGVDYLICDANANTNIIASTLCDGFGIAPSNNMIIINDPTITVMDLGVNNKIIQK